MPPPVAVRAHRLCTLEPQALTQHRESWWPAQGVITCW
jgi:hypothetical protein